MSITELSIKRPSLIIVIFTVLTVLGIYSYQQLSYELIPKFDAPFVVINTIYPGASPEEVENSVTKIIEEAVANMENVISTRSTSFESFSMVFLELKDGINVNIALADAQRKISAYEYLLPAQAKPPSLTKFATDEFPILNIGATSNLSPTAFYDLITDRIKPAFSSVAGVGEVRVVGGQEREVKVDVNHQALESRGLTILQIIQAIQSSNLDFPTGKIENREEQVLVRLAGKFQTIEELLELVVASHPVNGAPIKLREVADVTDSRKDASSISRVDGVDAISLQVLVTSDANGVAVANEVINVLSQLETQFKNEDLKFSVASNQTTFTIMAVDAVMHDLMLAIILVAIVMLIFLHSIRNAIIVMLAIPTSLVATLIMMYALGFSLNLMTLLAMSLVIGILVDDSIVVLENIYRHLERGVNRRKAALIGRNEIAFTALSITLVDVVVFVPIALTGGIVGSILKQFALVVAFSTLMSLFVSFTLTPMLASRFSRMEKFNNKTLFGYIFNGFEFRLKRLTNWYGRLISFLLDPIKIPYPAAYRRNLEASELADGRPRKKFLNFYLNGIVVFMLTGVMFFSSFLLVTEGYIGATFINYSDRGEFIVGIELPKTATLKETNLAAQKAEKILRSKPEITGVFTTVGKSSQMFTITNTPYIAEINVKLVDKQLREDKSAVYAFKVRNELEMALPGVKVTSEQVSFFGGADQEPIIVFISGTDMNLVNKYAEEALIEVKKVQGTTDTRLTVEEGNPEIKVSVDRERMANLGLNMSTVGATMQTAFNGNIDAKFRTASKEYDINVRMDQFNRNSINDISNLTLMNNKGQLIRMSQFANVVPSTGPNRLERKERLPSITLVSKVIGRPSGDVGTDVKKVFEEIKPPPPGVSVAYEGDMKHQADSFGSLGLAFAASILFVYLIMVALYDSWVYPLVVMFSLPVAIVGALLAMALTMSVLDIFSIMGIIMMGGLVAKNAILLVDFANQARAEGMNVHDALVEAGRTRLRPILMTTISMAVGFLPIALATGAGAEWKNGLAWALIGGLMSSMFLTLVIVPVIYLFMDGWRSLVAKFFRYIGFSSEEEETGNRLSLGGDGIGVESVEEVPNQ